uniref:Ropporin-1-like protein n=1 Tax=Oncorhynchus tshawytscha TaxID=74940 RepID=A0A8C8C0R8_ONCTS
IPSPDSMYCEQQINIPPELPDILKQFTKAAIRTQPHDILQWSAAYFSALSKGDTLPYRLEMPVATQKTDTGLTPGLLKVLHKQLALKETISKEEMQQKRKCLCLPSEQLDTLLALGNFNDNIHWMHFFALGGTIISTLRYVCEILTGNGEGGAERGSPLIHSSISSLQESVTNSSQFHLRGFIGMGNIAKAREIDQQKGYK